MVVGLNSIAQFSFEYYQFFEGRWSLATQTKKLLSRYYFQSYIAHFCSCLDWKWKTQHLEESRELFRWNDLLNHWFSVIIIFWVHHLQFHHPHLLLSDLFKSWHFQVEWRWWRSSWPFECYWWVCWTEQRRGSRLQAGKSRLGSESPFIFR